MPSPTGGGADADADPDPDAGVPEWTLGLPSDADLTPLSHLLVPAPLAAAFSITPEPPRTALDVHRASHASLSALRRHPSAPSAALKPFLADDPMILDPTDPEPRRPLDDPPDTNSSDNDPSARTLKRPRLVWTPQLHKRFVDVVAHLGIKNAVPKTIMQLMNVEGLTRENVASHLQKYRLYLKRMQGLSSEGPSSSDHLFASTPVPQSLHEPAPMPYAVPAMIPMPVFNVGHHGGSPVGMVPVSNQSPGAYRGFEQHHYGGFGEAPKDWSGGSNYRAVVSYPRVTPSDK